MFAETGRRKALESAMKESTLNDEREVRCNKEVKKEGETQAFVCLGRDEELGRASERAP